MELTPKQIKEELKERLRIVLLQLPDRFVNTFLFLYPEYSEQKKHIYNVSNGRSLDANVIQKFEEFAEYLKNKPKVNP